MENVIWKGEDEVAKIGVQQFNKSLRDKLHNCDERINTVQANLNKKVNLSTFNTSMSAMTQKQGDLTSLQTTEKSNLVGAINEVFQSANNSLQQVNNGKTDIKNAIVGVDDSIVIQDNPSFSNLVSAIGNISTGKKWASETDEGYYLPHSNLNYPMTRIFDLSFNPSIIMCIYDKGGYSVHHFTYEININEKKVKQGTSYITESSSYNSEVSAQCELINSGFKVTYIRRESGASRKIKPMTWLAIE